MSYSVSSICPFLFSLKMCANGKIIIDQERVFGLDMIYDCGNRKTAENKLQGRDKRWKVRKNGKSKEIVIGRKKRFFVYHYDEEGPAVLAELERRKAEAAKKLEANG